MEAPLALMPKGPTLRVVNRRPSPWDDAEWCPAQEMLYAQSKGPAKGRRVPVSAFCGYMEVVRPQAWHRYRTETRFLPWSGRTARAGSWWGSWSPRPPLESAAATWRTPRWQLHTTRWGGVWRLATTNA